MAFAALTGCVSPDGSGGSREGERVPVPDDVLLGAIEDVPGVTDVDVSYEDDVTNGEQYSGRLEVDDSANPACVLDRVYAILWQGRDAVIGVSVVQGGEVTAEPPPGISFFQKTDEMQDRYGPRPTEGVLVEPEAPPACR